MKTKEQWEKDNNYEKYKKQEEQLDKVRLAKAKLNEELRKLYVTGHTFTVKKKKLDVSYDFLEIKIDNKEGHTIAVI